MADKRLTQSPRAIREGKDPYHHKSEVQLDQEEPTRKNDSVNPGAFEDSESYNAPYEDGGGIYSRRR